MKTGFASLFVVQGRLAAEMRFASGGLPYLASFVGGSYARVPKA